MLHIYLLKNLSRQIYYQYFSYKPWTKRQYYVHIFALIIGILYILKHIKYTHIKYIHIKYIAKKLYLYICAYLCRNIVRLLLFICLLSLAFLSKAEPIEVFVSIPVQKTFIEKIALGHVKVLSMVESGHNPHFYEPNFKHISILARAKLYISNGMPFERVWLERIKQANPNMLIADGIAGIKLNKLEHNNNHHDKFDYHIWTNPLLVKQMAKNILNSLIKIDAKHRKYYTNNYQKFITELNKLDKDIRAMTDNLSNRSFMVFHPAWSYFANNYGLTQIAIQQEGRDINPKDLAKLIDLAKHKNIKTIFVQNEFSKHFARQISNDIGVKIVTINPLAADYIANMYYVVKKITEALK